MRFAQPGPAQLYKGVQITQVAIILQPTASPGPARRQAITGLRRPLPLVLLPHGRMPHTPDRAVQAVPTPDRAVQAAPTAGPVAVQAEVAAHTAHLQEAVLPTVRPAEAAVEADLTVLPVEAAVEADLTVLPAGAAAVQAGPVRPVAVQEVHPPQGDRQDCSQLLKES